MTIISVDLNSLEDELVNYIRDAGFEELARVAGVVFGGECWWADGDEFRFQPNENYTGNLNNFEEL